MAMLPMLRMIQEHEVPLFVECPLEEVERLAQELNPSGLAIRTSGLSTPDAAEALIDWRDEAYA